MDQLINPNPVAEAKANNSVEITLKDGQKYNCTGLSITTLKHLRRTGGEITVTVGEDKFVVKCKWIRSMQPINSLPPYEAPVKNI